MTEHGVNIARGNLERLRFFFSTVDNGRNNAARFQSARRRTAGRGPRFNFEFNLLCHVRYLSILNSDETDSSLWIRFIPSPRSSETQSTVVLNPSTGRTGVLVVVINPAILVFCNLGMSKNPCTCCACRSIVSTRLTPAAQSRFAINFAVIGTRGLSLRSWRA